jgi:hypothetical protein
LLREVVCLLGNKRRVHAKECEARKSEPGETKRGQDKMRNTWTIL